MTERWLRVAGYEGSYEVSDLGRVRGLDRVVERASGRGPNKTSTQRFPGRQLKPGLGSHGYPTVALSRRGVPRSFCIHDLVLTTFVGPRPAALECRHLDGNRQNPALINLCWGTRIENSADAAAHGTHAYGERVPNAKLTAAAAVEIMNLRGVVPQSELATIYGVSPSAVQSIHDRRSWKRATAGVA